MRNNLCQTPLEIACSAGDIPAQALHALISQRNINAHDKHGTTPVFHAMKYKNWQVVEALISRGADVNGENTSKTPILVDACAMPDVPLEIIRKLITPQNVNAQDEYEDSAILRAIQMRRWDIVEVLLQNGADPNLMNNYRYYSFLLYIQAIPLMNNCRYYSVLLYVQAIPITIRLEDDRQMGLMT